MHLLSVELQVRLGDHAQVLKHVLDQLYLAKGTCQFNHVHGLGVDRHVDNFAVYFEVEAHWRVEAFESE